MTDKNPFGNFNFTNDGGMDDVLDDIKSGVSLSFPYLRMWWWNGDFRMQAAGGIAYTGGWYTDTENVLALVESGVAFPSFLTETELIPRNGKPFKAFVANILFFAPFRMRQGWFQRENGKSYSKFEMLGMAAQKDNAGNLQYWLPVWVGMSGKQSTYLENLHYEFLRATAQARRDYANNTPASRFYHIIGSGKTPNIQTAKSRDGKESTITPPKLFLPDTIDEEFLLRYYIGIDLMPTWATLRDESKLWGEEWQQDDVKEREGAPRSSGNAAPPPSNPATAPDFPF